MRQTLRNWLRGAVLALVVPASVAAQTMITLDDAMARARTGTPGARVLAAGVAAADARVTQARSRFFPQIDLTHAPSG